MRVFEIYLRSGSKAELHAESFQDDEKNGNKIFFYADKSQNHLVAYFLRSEVSGIIFTGDKAAATGRHK